MRITGGAGERGYYFDRILSVVAQEFAQSGVAPHTLTARVSYTVPAGQMLYVSGVELRMIRDTAPTIGETFTVRLNYTPSGGVAHMLAYFTGRSILVNEGIEQYLTNPFIAMPGDTISIATSDGSTGGSTEIDVALVGFTFER